ncbi:hypothetical protein [Mycolicibacterium aubagnense]|uniref:Antitoxin n=1 Tax=Mycolicibacterium aubagnense TaxID=319707 RepID=A0ABN5YPR1_9MYCO|nr:hypothetical protein [Mycolicibacterium aubagnense]TLH69538.1 hypothetical protein C1S80_02055 [Mycolicibacterium aubagnense]WGI35108.1 hypothetical protein QDT91_12630 [Mycolicibacterium aubagnense]BBX82950.1 hypothetical protein MAUB_08230 [Mycolicibacterium aubagnense]
MTEPIPRGDDADLAEQGQSVGDTLADADETWVNGVVQQWDADLADTLDQHRPIPEFDDDRRPAE